MVWNPDIVWVNPDDKVYVSEHKIHKRVSDETYMGFTVPRTSVIERSERVTGRCEEQSGEYHLQAYLPWALRFDGSDAYRSIRGRCRRKTSTERIKLKLPVLMQAKD